MSKIIQTKYHQDNKKETDNIDKKILTNYPMLELYLQTHPLLGFLLDGM